MKHNRIYISADIEGTSGVVTPEQLGPKGFEYQAAREWMTAEVNAACEAASVIALPCARKQQAKQP